MACKVYRDIKLSLLPSATELVSSSHSRPSGVNGKNNFAVKNAFASRSPFNPHASGQDRTSDGSGSSGFKSTFDIDPEEIQMTAIPVTFPSSGLEDGDRFGKAC